MKVRFVTESGPLIDGGIVGEEHGGLDTRGAEHALVDKIDFGKDDALQGLALGGREDTWIWVPPGVGWVLKTDPAGGQAYKDAHVEAVAQEVAPERVGEDFLAR